MKKFIVTIMAGVMTMIMLTGISILANANTMQSARLVDKNGSFGGVLSENEESYCHRMALDSAGTLTFTVTSYVDDELGIGIYDAQYQAVVGDYVRMDSASKVGVETMSFELDRGTYYIRAIGNTDWDSSYSYDKGTYTIKSSFKSAGVNHSENNNEFSAASTIKNKAKIKGHIAKNNVCDYYKFRLSKASKVSFRTTSYFERIGFRIYNSSFESITGDTVYWENASKVGVDTLSYDLDKGTYYVRVIGNYWDYTDTYYYGKYNFTFTAKVAGVNHKENNNSFEQASNIQVKKPIKGQIALNNRVDYYKIKVNKPGRIKIRVNSKMKYLGYSIYNGSYERLTGNSKYWNDASQRISWTDTYTVGKGTYYIRFIGSSWSDSSDSSYFGNYNFKVYR